MSRSSSDRPPAWRAVLGTTVTLLFLAAPAPAMEPADLVELVWVQPEGPQASGFAVLVGRQPGRYEQIIDVGPLAPSRFGLIRDDLPIDRTRDAWIALVAYNAAGASAPSNELFVPAIDLAEPGAAALLVHPSGDSRWTRVHPAGSVERILAEGLADAGQTHAAWCDLAGDGTRELVVGYGPGGGGWLALAGVEGATVGVPLPFEAGSTSYRQANGEWRPACGDLDGDGRDEIALAPGVGGNGELLVLDDAAKGLAPLSGLPGGTLRWTSWPPAMAAGGEARAAAGDVDGDGLDELVIAFGLQGGGWLQVRDDAGAGFASLGWVRWSDDESYAAQHGGGWPALGDADGDGRDEIAVGYDAGGGGRIALIDDALAGFAPLAGSSGLVVDGAGDGSTRPAWLDVDGDGRSELVVGLGGEAADRVYWLDDALAGFGPHPATPGGSGFVAIDPPPGGEPPSPVR